MISYDRKDGWDENDPSARQQESAEQAAGKAEEAAAARAKVKVLARLPNLDVAEADRVAGGRLPRASRRKLQQRLSAAILVGGTLALVAMAVYPHLRGPGRYENGQWVTPNPRPDAEEAAPFHSGGQQTSAPQAQSDVPAPAIDIEIPAVSIPGGPAPDPTVVPAAPQNSPIGMPPMLPSGQPAPPTPIPAMPAPPAAPVAPPAPPVTSNQAPPSAYSLPGAPTASTLFTNTGRDLNGPVPAPAFGVSSGDMSGVYRPATNPVGPAAYPSTYPNTNLVGPVMPILPSDQAAPPTLSASRYGSPDSSTARQ